MGGDMGDGMTAWVVAIEESLAVGCIASSEGDHEHRASSPGKAC